MVDKQNQSTSNTDKPSHLNEREAQFPHREKIRSMQKDVGQIQEQARIAQIQQRQTKSDN